MDNYSVAFCLPFPADIQLRTDITIPSELLMYFNDLWNQYIDYLVIDSQKAKDIDRCTDLVVSVITRFHATLIRMTQLPDIGQVGFEAFFPYSAYADAFCYEYHRRYPFLNENFRWHNLYNKGVDLYPWYHVSISIPNQYYVLIGSRQKDDSSVLLNSIKEAIRHTKAKNKLKLLQKLYDFVLACIQCRAARIHVDETSICSSEIRLHFHFFTKSDSEKMNSFLEEHHYSLGGITIERKECHDVFYYSEHDGK